MSTARQLLSPLALVACTGLVAACGSSPGGAGPTPERATVSRGQGVRFAQCIRRHGVAGFPDPSGSGGFTLDSVANGSSVDLNGPVFQQALTACRRLEPAGFTGGPRSPAQQLAALQFARCVRAHGVRDFPDPAEGQPLIDTTRIPSSDAPGGMSILNAATHACSADATAAIGHRP